MGIVQQKITLYLQLIRWNRPVGWMLLLWPTLSALWLAAQHFPGAELCAIFILGTILMRSAGCCINDIADRDFDKHVKRTEQRPVTTGVVSVREALIVGAVLALCAFLLVLRLPAQVLALSCVALLITLLYPFAKRFIAMPQAVLGLAFSLGIPMAFASIQTNIPTLAWYLFFTNICWVIAFDTVYAMVDKDDDLRIGIRTSAITFGRYDVAAVMALYTLHLLLWLALALWLKMSPIFYIALTIAALQVLAQYRLIRQRDRQQCLRAFRYSHGIGATLWLGLVLHY